MQRRRIQRHPSWCRRGDAFQVSRTVLQVGLKSRKAWQDTMHDSASDLLPASRSVTHPFHSYYALKQDIFTSNSMMSTGHSLTIVGFERRTDGSNDLIVFDPMFQDSITLTKSIDRVFHHNSPDAALKLYRRGSKYLRKYHEFEILRWVT